MRKTSILALAGLVVLAGCGDEDESTRSRKPPPNDGAAMKQEQAAKPKEDAAMKGAEAPSGKGTTITVGDSDFGAMLFNTKKQAIYIFEKDRDGQTVCYDECAEAWPPVFTQGKPKAAGGAKQSLLGSLERRDGRQQVTYAGKPLYFYAHERPGEVRCHNVNLNGGLWWVVGADGKRRP